MRVNFGTKRKGLSAGALIALPPVHFAQAEDDSEFSSTEGSDSNSQLTRDQWREQVRTTKLRILEQAARRLIQDTDNGPTEVRNAPPSGFSMMIAS